MVGLHRLQGWQKEQETIARDEKRNSLMEIMNAGEDRVELPRTYYIFVSKLYRLCDCRYCSYRNMIYEMHTAANFPFVMAVFLHTCA